MINHSSFKDKGSLFIWVFLGRCFMSDSVCSVSSGGEMNCFWPRCRLYEEFRKKRPRYWSMLVSNNSCLQLFWAWEYTEGRWSLSATVDTPFPPLRWCIFSCSWKNEEQTDVISKIKRSNKILRRSVHSALSLHVTDMKWDNKGSLTTRDTIT